PVSGRIDPARERDSAVLDPLRPVRVRAVDGLHDGILTGIGRRNADQGIPLVFVVGKRRRIPGRRQGAPRLLGLIFAILFFRREEFIVVGLVKPEEAAAVFSLGLNAIGEAVLSRVGFLLGGRGIGRLGATLLHRFRGCCRLPF